MNFQSIVHSLKLVTKDGPTNIARYRAAIAAKNNASMFFTFIPRSQIYQDIAFAVIKRCGDAVPRVRKMHAKNKLVDGK